MKLTDKTQVLEQYREYDIPFFAIFSGKDIVCIYQGDNMDEGAERLEKFLDLADGTVLKIRMYDELPAKAKITARMKKNLTTPAVLLVAVLSELCVN